MVAPLVHQEVPRPQLPPVHGWPKARVPSLPFLLPVCAGNLARFLNHSCDYNLVKQPVLVPGHSGLRYRMAFFAMG